MASRKPTTSPEFTGTSSARRTPAALRRLPRPESLIAFDGNLFTIPLPKPSAALIPCSTPLTKKSGSIASFNGVITHAGPDYKYVALTCLGFDFGSIAMATFAKIADGHSFKGNHQFCWIKKCSNGAPSTSLISLAGTITLKTGIVTLEMNYEFQAFCGGEVGCTEEGTFTGTMSPKGPDPLNASYVGRQDWTVTCCPDLQ